MIGLENVFMPQSAISVVLVVFIIILITFIVITAGLLGVYEEVSSRTSSWFHHYTNEDSLKKILKTGFIRASTDIKNDAFGGIGSYFTQLPPRITSKDVLAQNNYANLAKEKLLAGKLDCCISVLLTNSDMKNVSQNGRNIFLYPGHLFLSGVKNFVIT